MRVTKAKFLTGLALATSLVSAEASGQDPNFGMPPAAAAQARQFCAKHSSGSFFVQAACMEQEAASYRKLGRPSPEAVRMSPEEDANRAPRVRRDTNYRDPGFVDMCPTPHYRMTQRDGCQPTRR